MKKGWLGEQISLTEERTRELPPWKKALRDRDKEVLLAGRDSEGTDSTMHSEERSSLSTERKD